MDKLKSYSAAKAEVMPSIEQLQQEVSKQSSRKFAPTDQIAREGNEAVQVSRQCRSDSFRPSD